MSISAMKQALEALDCIYSPLHVREINKVGEAMSALRQAIAEAEKQEPVAIGEEWKPCVKLPIIVHVREQRKGENHVSTREGITPVKEDDLIMRGVAGEEYPIGRELFNRTYTFDTAPVHASDISQECVDETEKREHEFECPRCGHCCQQREWVGLTDEEVDDIWNRYCDEMGEASINDAEDIARAIEAKLKEKNTGETK
jgi:hypothetical protein